jgi:putative endonuclease
VEGTRGAGQRGEALAGEYLARNGFRILALNYRYLRKEIDLIVAGEGFLVFVEVKWRRDDRFGGPLAAVDPRKQRAIAACARGFLHERRMRDVACRFDVVGISQAPGEPPRIEHIRDAFRAPV